MPFIMSDRGDYNLPTLAGLIMDMTEGHEMPLPLYVAGCAERDDMIYLDPMMEYVEEIHEFLAGKDIPVSIGIPIRTQIRPSIVISRGMRDDDRVQLAAVVCAFVMFCIHETIRLRKGDMANVYNFIVLQENV